MGKTPLLNKITKIIAEKGLGDRDYQNVIFNHNTDYFMCFYRIKEYEDHINNGYEMYLTSNDRRSNILILSDLTIELRKKIKL